MSVKEIRVNGFLTAAPGHLSPGLWTHPQDQSLRYNELAFWAELAQLAERGLYDALFWSDGLTNYDVYRGSHDTAVRLGIQFPRLDPVPLITALALSTNHLGFAVTSSTSYEQPFNFARRMSTLDHFTQGRIAWNIVTSYGDSGARALGLAGARPHDERYDVADEYMDVVYKLWEGSWEEGAVLRDKATRQFADPARVHEVRHAGKYFHTQGTHYAEPSPQRTPLLYQAGSSGRGKDFSARHAECVFLSGPSKVVIQKEVADTRRRAALLGRGPKDLLFFMMATVVVGNTEKEAADKLENLRSYIDLEGALTLFSRWIGHDLSAYDANEPLRYLKSESMQSTLEAFTVGDPEREWTIGDIARHIAIGGQGPLIVGSAAQVADQLESWMDDTDIDGFNLCHALLPDSHKDFIDLVVPVLQERGRYKKRYSEGTLREKIFGAGKPRLGASHPAASFRRLRPAPGSSEKST